MEHLYVSTVEGSRLTVTSESGMPNYAYNIVESLAQVLCRLDIGFLRQGKDQPMASEAGRAPDRVGVMYCNADVPWKPGDRLTCIDGPVQGTFEIRVIPDQALDFAGAHHTEVQIIECASQIVNQGQYPPNQRS